MRSVVVLLGILFVISLSSQTVNACTCGGSGSACESYGKASAVFVGTVVAVRENERPQKPDRSEVYSPPKGYKFSVEQSYLGIAGTEVEVFTGYGGGDCGYEFKIGQRYLVYAYRNQDKLNTSICTRTTSFSNATDDLAFLGTLSSTAPGVTIYGGIMNEESEPLSPDILFTIEGESERKEIRPDAEGRFRVSGLRAGKYKVSVKLPETLTTWRHENEITVADRGCAAVGWYVTDNGRVSGRVINAEGQPVARILVSLLYAGTDSKEHDEKSVETDSDGQFMISAILRGRYLIAVNRKRFPDPNDTNNAYPPSFYPGVVDRTHAEAITIGPGEKLADLEVRIPLKRPASILNGSVVWSDGLPVAKAELSVMDVTENENGMSYLVVADELGQFKIEGYTGQKLVIEARSNRPYVRGSNPNEPMERADKKRITLARPSEALRIVITKLR